MSDIKPEIKAWTKPVAILTGPTASGKSGIAFEFALNHPQAKIELINADSVIVYSGFDIGSAKPSAAEQKAVPHHMIDILDPSEQFTAGGFLSAVEYTIANIHQRGARALIVGGTGFYLKALIYGLWEAPPTDPEFRASIAKQSNPYLWAWLNERDPETAKRIPLADRYRLVRALEIIETSGKLPSELREDEIKESRVGSHHLNIDRESADLETRIATRTAQMIRAGWVEETARLLEQTPHAPALKSVGYREVVGFLKGEKPEGREILAGLSGLESEINLATRQLVKRQRTWFKSQAKEAERFLLETDRNSLGERLQSIYL